MRHAPREGQGSQGEPKGGPGEPKGEPKGGPREPKGEPREGQRSPEGQWATGFPLGLPGPLWVPLASEKGKMCSGLKRELFPPLEALPRA